MARNEEKQLARLNRFYLRKQNEEQLAKRPPRPRLETLVSADDVKKWIPSILKDIEYYIKQMEVSCYPKKTIEEFERKIGNLRGEYKAFVRKVRELEPDLSATPWSDRPYTAKRTKLPQGEAGNESDKQGASSSNVDSISQQGFSPIPAPIMSQKQPHTKLYYGSNNLPTRPLSSTPAVARHCEGQDIFVESHSGHVQLQDKPLEFNFDKHKPVKSLELNFDKQNSVKPLGFYFDKQESVKPLQHYGKKIHSSCATSGYSCTTSFAEPWVNKNLARANVETTSSVTHTFPPPATNALLNIPYSDSSSDESS